MAFGFFFKGTRSISGDPALGMQECMEVDEALVLPRLVRLRSRERARGGQGCRSAASSMGGPRSLPY